jgi:hypothetical protein
LVTNNFGAKIHALKMVLPRIQSLRGPVVFSTIIEAQRMQQNKGKGCMTAR